MTLLGFPDGALVKGSTYQCRGHRRHRFNPWVGKIPWKRKRQPTPVLLPGEFHGQRRMVGYSPGGLQKNQTHLKGLSTCTHTHTDTPTHTPLKISTFFLMDCRPPGSSVHGISQARMPEWVAISSSRGSSLNIVSYNFYRNVPFSIQIYCHNVVCSIF